MDHILDKWIGIIFTITVGIIITAVVIRMLWERLVDLFPRLDNLFSRKE